jgi:N-methylhydantoinase A
MNTSAEFLVGVDVGGTFTDILAYQRSGEQLLAAKVSSFPGEQWRGILDALSALGISPKAVLSFVHGTTIATNGILERKGAPTALVTTKGFRDVLEIGKGRRLVGGLFDAAWRRPEPLVPRDLRVEVSERVRADGSAQAGVEETDFESIANFLRKKGVSSIAVAFLNSYVNDSNEKEAVAVLRALMPEACISHSSALAPERGEFERTSTCVLNAYLTPMMIEYLNALVAALGERGVTAPVSVMGSNGGAMTLAEARNRVVGTFLSGPIGGVTGAIRVAKSTGLSDIITFDMGGTSTDVALVQGVEPRMSYNNQIGAYPLQVPQLDIHTIGSGGGSIIWIGDDGTLQVGPQSAGATPGPACYGRGGRLPTISDANLILGRLSTKRSLSGGLKLDIALAQQSFRAIAEHLGNTDVLSIANGALRIAVAKMVGAVREVSVHRGFDPRAFTLVGFGGAGPMHVFEVAKELGICVVMIPRFPGHLCALGQMFADLRRDSVVVWGGRLSDLSVSALKVRACGMRDEAERRLAADGIARESQRHVFTLDMRYSGQSFTIPIPWREDDQDLSTVRSAFDACHQSTFGHSTTDKDVEIVNVRLASVGIVDKPELKFATARSEQLHTETRRVWLSGWQECRVLHRDAMESEYTFRGPAIVEEAGSTSVIPPDWSVSVHESGALLCKQVSEAFPAAHESRVSNCDQYPHQQRKER